MSRDAMRGQSKPVRSICTHSHWECSERWATVRAVECPWGESLCDGAVVVTIGERPDGAARDFAVRRGQRYEHAPSLDAVSTRAEGWGCRYVTVVAESTPVRCAEVGLLNHRFRSLGMRWGLVPDDGHGLQRRLDASLLESQQAPHAATVLDALGGRIGTPQGWTPFADGGIVEALHSPGALAIVGHGEGAHINLDEVVICGAPPEGEHDARRTPLKGGCDGQGHCRRAAPEQVVVNAREVAASVILLLTCNSFDISGEIWPTDASLVLAALSGHASAVIASHTRMAVAPMIAGMAFSEMARGAPLGDVVALMNAPSSLSRHADSFTLVGDPLQRVSVVAPEGAVSAIPGDASALELPEVLIDGHPTELVARVEGRVFAARPPAADARCVERSADAVSLRMLHRRDCARAKDMQWAEAGCISSLAADAAADAANHLESLASTRQELELRALLALRDLADVASNRVWRASVQEQQQSIPALYDRWDSSFVDVVARFLPTASLDAVLTAFYEPVTTRTQRCPRCGNGVLSRRMNALDGCSSPREHDECGLCGPLSTRLVEGPVVTLSSPASVRAGSDVEISVTFDYPLADDGVNWHGAVILVDQTRRRRCAAQLRLRSATDGSPARGTLPVPADLGLGIHTVYFVYSARGRTGVECSRVLNMSEFQSNGRSHPVPQM